MKNKVWVFLNGRYVLKRTGWTSSGLLSNVHVFPVTLVIRFSIGAELNDTYCGAYDIDRQTK